MIYIGCHLSTTHGYAAMGSTITAMGGDTFAWFTRNPRGGRSTPPEEADVAALKNYAAANLGPLVAHASYTMNLCSAKEETRQNGLDMLRRDLQIMDRLPGNLYNFHPGCHTGQGLERGIAQIADALNQVLSPETPVTILLETMAGKGTEIGSRFEELRAIIDRVAKKDKLGVCFDTCHTWDAGYDIVGDLDGVLTRFDKIVGIERLKAVHFNDSKNPLGAKKDRHEKLGQGCIGLDALKRVALHPSLSGLPFILETPNDDEGYIAEIRMIREWMDTGN